MRKFCLSLIAMLMVTLYANAWKFTVSSPAEGEVTEIYEIVLDNPAGEGWLNEWRAVACTMTCPGGKVVTYNLANSNPDKTSGTPTPSATLTDHGTYTLTIPAGSFHLMSGVACEAMTFTWTIGGGAEDLNDYALNVSQPVGGTITASKTQAKVGEEITLTQEAADGYEFVSWNVRSGGSSVTVTSNKFRMPAADVTISAVFAKKYSITVSNQIENGIVSVKDNIALAKEGEIITLVPTPSSGYKLESWNVVKGNGETVTVTKNKFTMPASDVTISATFIEGEDVIYDFSYEDGQIRVVWPEDNLVPNSGQIQIDGYDTPLYGFYLANSKVEYFATTYDMIRVYATLPDGKYTFVIPAGYVTIDGVQNEEIRIPFTVGDVTGPITIEMSEALYSTFVPSGDVDMTSNSNLEAYAVTEVHNGYIKLAQVTQVPENTAVIVKSNEPGQYQVNRMEGATLGVANFLKSSSSDTYVSNKNRYYILANGSNGVGFYPVQQYTSIPAKKGYLEITGDNGAKSYAFDFDGVATDIQGLVFDKLDGSREIYDLQGRRLQQMKRGINIVNGKKVIK